jgi:hypothetical protein
MEKELLAAFTDKPLIHDMDAARGGRMRGKPQAALVTGGNICASAALR